MKNLQRGVRGNCMNNKSAVSFHPQDKSSGSHSTQLMKKEKCQAINKKENSQCILNKGHQGAHMAKVWQWIGWIDAN